MLNKTVLEILKSMNDDQLSLVIASQYDSSVREEAETYAQERFHHKSNQD